MAKLKDKLYNRIIEGKLTLEEGDELEEAQIKTNQLKDSSANNGKVLKVNATGGIEPTDSIDIASVKGDEIVENMSGYSFTPATLSESWEKEEIYSGVVKNGNKLTLVSAFNLTRVDTSTGVVGIGKFTIPSSVLTKLFTTQIGSYSYLQVAKLTIFTSAWSSIDIYVYCNKAGTDGIAMYIDSGINTSAVLNSKYYIRYEVTFLLSENLA